MIIGADHRILPVREDLGPVGARERVPELLTVPLDPRAEPEPFHVLDGPVASGLTYPTGSDGLGASAQLDRRDPTGTHGLIGAPVLRLLLLKTHRRPQVQP